MTITIISITDVTVLYFIPDCCYTPLSLLRLQLAACRCARKEGNTGLARRLLLAYWRGKTQTPDLPDDEVFASLEPALWVKQGAGLALKETAKLLYRSEIRLKNISFLFIALCHNDLLCFALKTSFI